MKPITNEESDKISRDTIDKMSVEPEENVLMLLNSSEDFIFILDKEGNIVSINDTVLKALKYSEKELLRMNVLDLHPPEQRNEATSTVRELIKGKRKSLTAPFVTKDNNHIYIEAILTRGRWKNQDVFIGICRDITERKRIERLLKESDKNSERRLKESEAKFRNIITHLSDVLVEIDDKGEIIYISPQTFEIFGYRPEDLIGKNYSKFIHPKDLSIITDKIQKSLNSEEAITFEYRARHKNGKYITMSVKGNKIINEDGIRYVGVLRDNTEQIEAEQKLREIEEDKKRLKKISQIEPEVRFWKLIQPKKDVSVVQKTRQMLETVLDNIPISIYWKGLDLKFIGCNENFANLVQIETPNHVIDKKSENISLIAENSQLINERESKIIKNGLP